MASNLIHNIASDGWSWWCDESRIHGKVCTMLVIVLVILWYKWTSKRLRKHEPPLPPGPRGLPLVGSLPFLEPDLHCYFSKLARVYGPITKLRMGSKLWVVVSSPSLAKEVLRDHDAIFANRSIPVSALAASYGGQDIAWSPHGPTWRMLRKVFVRELLSNTNLEATSTLRKQEVHRRMKDLYTKTGKPVTISEEMFLISSEVILNMLWGETLQGSLKLSPGAEFKKVVEEMIELVTKPNVSDFFPILARFDIQGIERRSKELLSCFDNIVNPIIEQKQKKDVARREDTFPQSEKKDFLQILLELVERQDPEMPLTMEQLKAMFVDIFAGATDTTSTTLDWALTEMMNRPDVMRKAQEELEEVVGLNHMVQDSHLPKLHFLGAVLKEILRLHPALPLLVPHCPSESCTLGGYAIPKSTAIFINVWAIQRDPEAWEDPLAFRPERFMNDGNKCDYRGSDFHYLPFGSGRRICVGIPLAERMLIYVLASLLHSFDWKLPDGAKLDFSEKFGIVLKKAVPLVAIPTPRLLDHELYT